MIKNTYWLSLHVLTLEDIKKSLLSRQKGFNRRAAIKASKGWNDDAKYWRSEAEAMQPSIDEITIIINMKKEGK